MDDEDELCSMLLDNERLDAGLLAREELDSKPCEYDDGAGLRNYDPYPYDEEIDVGD